MGRCGYVEIVHRISEWVFVYVVKSRAQERRWLVEAIWYCSNSADSVFVVDWWLQLQYDASEWVDTESYAAFEEFGDRYIQFQQHAYLFALPFDVTGDNRYWAGKLCNGYTKTTRWRILHSQLSQATIYCSWCVWLCGLQCHYYRWSPFLTSASVWSGNLLLYTNSSFA